MKKKGLNGILTMAAVLTVALAGCGQGTATTSENVEEKAGGTLEKDENTGDTLEKEEGADDTLKEKTEETGDKKTDKGMTVGVAMPTQSSERWIRDGKNMKEKLEALGYEVDLQYAEDDVAAQTQ